MKSLPLLSIASLLILNLAAMEDNRCTFPSEAALKASIIAIPPNFVGHLAAHFGDTTITFAEVHQIFDTAAAAYVAATKAKNLVDGEGMEKTIATDRERFLHMLLREQPEDTKQRFFKE